MLITSELMVGEVELKSDPALPHRVHTGSFVDEQEFKLYRHVRTSFPHLTMDPRSPMSKQPSMKVSCYVGRRPQYFVWNGFVIMASFFLSLSSPQVYTVAMNVRSVHSL